MSQQLSSDRDNCIYNMPHHNEGHWRHNMTKRELGLTVNSDSDTFCQGIVVRTDKAGYPAKWIDFEVLGRCSLGRLGIHKLDVDVVGFGNSTDCCRACIALH